MNSTALVWITFIDFMCMVFVAYFFIMWGNAQRIIRNQKKVARNKPKA